MFVPARGPSTSFSSQIVSSPLFPAAPCLLLNTPCNQTVFPTCYSFAHRKHGEDLRGENVDAAVDDAADVAARLLHIMEHGVRVLVLNHTTIVHRLLPGGLSAQDGGNLEISSQMAKTGPSSPPCLWRSGTPASPAEGTQHRRRRS